MRHKYRTESFVLHRIPVGESSYVLLLLTSELGMVYARAQAVRAKGAKLAHALQTLSLTLTTLTKGVAGWRISGAVLMHSYARSLSLTQKKVITNTTSLLLSLSHDELHDSRLFETYSTFIARVHEVDEEFLEACEYAGALAFLHIHGYVQKLHAPLESIFEKASLEYVRTHTDELLVIINKGIAAAKS